MTEHEIQTLLQRSSGGEMPKGYPEALLKRFHERQRSELLRRSLWRIVFERIATFWSEHSMRDSTYTLAMAAVAVVSMGAIFLFKTQAQYGNSTRLEFSSAGEVMARRSGQPTASERATLELNKKPGAPIAPFGRQAPLEAQQVSFDK